MELHKLAVRGFPRGLFVALNRKLRGAGANKPSARISDHHTMTANHANRKAAEAFSIVEVVFVVAILGILGAIALPRYAGFTARQQTNAAARRLVSDLTLAQRRARLGSSTQRVQFTVGGSQYQLVNMKDPDRPLQDYIVDLSRDPYRASIIAAEFGGDAEVAFDGFGAADTPGTVVLGVGRYRQVITIDGGATRPRMSDRITVEAME